MDYRESSSRSTSDERTRQEIAHGPGRLMMRNREEEKPHEQNGNS